MWQENDKIYRDTIYFIRGAESFKRDRQFAKGDRQEERDQQEFERSLFRIYGVSVSFWEDLLKRLENKQSFDESTEGIIELGYQSHIDISRIKNFFESDESLLEVIFHITTYKTLSSVDLLFIAV